MSADRWSGWYRQNKRQPWCLAATGPDYMTCRQRLDDALAQVCQVEGLTTVDTLCRETGRGDPNSEIKAR